MQQFGLYVLTPLLSFFGGFYAYVWILNNYWKQELGGDAISVVIFGGLAFVSLAVPLYFLIIEFIDKRFSHFKLLLYPLMCMLTFFLPVLLIMAVWDGSNVLSAESLLFYAFFLASGFIFGVLNWLFKKI